MNVRFASLGRTLLRQVSEFYHRKCSLNTTFLFFFVVFSVINGLVFVLFQFDHAFLWFAILDDVSSSWDISQLPFTPPSPRGNLVA